MKRIIILFLSFTILAIIGFSYYLIQYNNNQNEINKFNYLFLEYNRDNLYGTDITSVINKAMNNNENYKIKKNESNEYISDENYSTKIYVKFEKEGSEYSMERIYKVGIQEFTSYFGELRFKCEKINYHKNGRISEMYFSAINY